MIYSLGQGSQTARFLDTWGNYVMLVNFKGKKPTSGVNLLLNLSDESEGL